jgi:gas vesicle protein
LRVGAASFKEKFAKASHVAENETVAILADTLSNMEKSIQDSINRLESRFKKDLRTIIREEIAGVVKNEIQKELKNLEIVYKQN